MINMSALEFIDGPKSGDPNSVWHYFLKEKVKPSNHEQCKSCGHVLKSQGGTTSSLWAHLKQHPMIEVPTKDTNLVLQPQKVHDFMSILILVSYT